MLCYFLSRVKCRHVAHGARVVGGGAMLEAAEGAGWEEGGEAGGGVAVGAELGDGVGRCMATWGGPLVLRPEM